MAAVSYHETEKSFHFKCINKNYDEHVLQNIGGL